MFNIASKLSERIVETKTGCWEYTGARNFYGYGVITLDYKQHRVHRLVYELNIGSIPDGKLVLHKCDNRACCNPDHLFLGTYQDNVDDMVEKGRDSYGQNIGENNGQAILTTDEVYQIRKLLAENRYTQGEIGAMFGVGRGAVKQIKLGYTWKHLQ